MPVATRLRRFRKSLVVGLLALLLIGFVAIPTNRKLVWLRNTPLCEREKIIPLGLTGVTSIRYRFRPTGSKFLVVVWDEEVLFSARSTLGFSHGGRGFSLVDGREFEFVFEPGEKIPRIVELERTESRDPSQSR